MANKPLTASRARWLHSRDFPALFAVTTSFIRDLEIRKKETVYPENVALEIGNRLAKTARASGWLLTACGYRARRTH